MKYVYSLVLFVCFTATGTVKAECDHYMSAQQVIDQILTEASKEVDIEQAPKDGNTQAPFKSAANLSH